MGTREILLIIFLSIYFILSGIEIFFCFKSEKYRKIFKGLPILVLIILTISLMPNEPLIYCAFICGLIGDLLLISKNKQVFLLGLGSFLLEHLLLSIKLFLISTINFTYPFYLVYFGALLMIVFFSYIAYSKYLKLKILIPASIYLFAQVVNFVLFIALTIILKNNIFICGIFGYAIFTFSDFLVLHKRFIKRKVWHEYTIMSTYYIAQFLIFMSLLFL